MKHPLESENEDIRNRIEDTYQEITRVNEKLAYYNIKDMIVGLATRQESTEYTNTILTNKQTFNDIIKWGNGK